MKLVFTFFFFFTSTLFLFAEKEGPFTFVVDNNQAILTGVDEQVSGNIIIPENLKGYPILTIETNAFKNNIWLKSVGFPRNLENIRSGAFIGCVNLESLTVPWSVTNIGEYAFSNCSSLHTLRTSAEIKEIARGLFANCGLLKTVSIPSTVTSIEEYAFSNCESLESLSIPESVMNIGAYAFENCFALKEVQIPQNVETLGHHTFSSCRSLVGVVLPTNLVSISDFLFSDCSELTSVRLPRTVRYVGCSAFQNCDNLISLSIPEKVDFIGESAFQGCQNLTTVVLMGHPPKNVGEKIFDNKHTSSLQGYYSERLSLEWSEVTGTNGIWQGIQMSAYKHLSAEEENKYDYRIENNQVAINGYFSGDDWSSPMRNLCIPSILDGYPVVEIRMGTFSGYGNLSSVEIPSTVKTIEGSAFEDCYNLSFVSIPSSVTNIGYKAFSLCSGIHFEVAPENPNYSSVEGGLFNKTKTEIIKGPGDLKFYKYEIPTGVITIAPDAFEDCIWLTSVKIPESVSTICSNAFMNCSYLQSIRIPEGVTHIGEYAFNGCGSLISVEIPSTILSIGDYAFPDVWDYNPDWQYGVWGTWGEAEFLSIMFRGRPPQTMGKQSFEFSERKINGYYPCQGSNMWNSVIHEGTWRGLCMRPYNHSPEKIQSLFEYIVTNGVAIITGFDPSFSGDITIPQTLGTYPVAGIATDAFRYCTWLTGVRLPSGLTEIGKYAFNYCSDLENVSIPEGVMEIKEGTFSDCIKLSSIVIPEGVTNVSEYAFYRSLGLRSVTIPSSVEAIGWTTFMDCSSVKINVHSENPYYASEMGTLLDKSRETLLRAYVDPVSNSYKAPETVIYIRSDAFSGCRKIKLTLPASLRIIDSEVFYKIDFVIFEGIPPYILGDLNFNGRGDAPDCFYPRSENAAWWAVIDRNNRWLGMPVNAYDLSASGNDELFSYTIDAGQTILTGFERSYSGKISIPPLLGGSPVTEIGPYAFSGCCGLTSISLHGGVLKIGKSGFGGCTGLYSVKIPDHVTLIEDRAFSHCTNLSCIIFNGQTPPTLGNEVFSGTSKKIKGYYPRTGESEWKAVIGETGKWKGIQMEPYDPNSPDLDSLFTYETRDGETHITGFDRDFSGAITIPVILGGAPVSSIQPYSFSGCCELTSIVLPPELCFIGFAAFSGCTGLYNVEFKGKPPCMEEDVFIDTPPEIRGFYPAEEKIAWETVIDASGYWNRLAMRLPFPTFPPGVDDTLSDWLSSQLGEQGITSGTVSFHPDTTVETLDAARILGIVPSVTQSGGDVSVAAGGKLEIVDLTVTGETITLTIKVTASAGTLPVPYRPAGDLVLLGYESLDGEGIPLTPVESSGWRSNTKGEAVITLTYGKSNSHFFRYLLQ